MKNFLRFIILGLMISAFVKDVHAQGEAAVPFLLLAPDSRAGGIGESGTGLGDNSAAIFWNPAGLAFQSGSEVTITHSNWLPQFQLDLFYDYLTYRTDVPEIDGVISSSITYMNFGEFIRTSEFGPEEIGRFRSFDAALTLGYATKLSQDWGLGFNARIIHSRLSDKPTGEEKGSGIATTVSFDVAAMWRPVELYIPFTDVNIGNKLSIGANLSNIGPKIYYIDQDQADALPTNFRLGFAYNIYKDEYNSLVYTLDFSKLLVSREAYYVEGDTVAKYKVEDVHKAIFTAWADQPMSEELKDVVTSTGIEYWYGQPNDFLFALRAGYFYEDPSKGNRKFLSFGAGIRYDMYGFDFSYLTTSMFKGQETHPLNETLRFTLLVNWGSIIPTQKSLGMPKGI